MGRIILLLSGCCCLLLFLSGCVLKSGVTDTGGRTQPALSDTDRQIDALNHTLDASRSETGQCQADLERLEDRFETVDTEVQLNRRQIESLNKSIEKQAAVISLQNSIIRLFDDSRQTLQNNLREQIKAGDLETGGSTQSIKLCSFKQSPF